MIKILQLPIRTKLSELNLYFKQFLPKYQLYGLIVIGNSHNTLIKKLSIKRTSTLNSFDIKRIYNFLNMPIEIEFNFNWGKCVSK